MQYNVSHDIGRCMKTGKYTLFVINFMQLNMNQIVDKLNTLIYFLNLSHKVYIISMDSYNTNS